jgi:hypothetical protein
MGIETAVGLGLSALGAGINAKNQHDTAVKQDQNAAQSIISQAADQRKAASQVNQEIDKVGASTPEAARQASLNAFMTQLQQSRSQAGGGANEVGGSRFATDKASAGKEVTDFGTRTAALLSRINAPTLQRQQERQGMSQLGSDLSETQRQSQADQFLSQLRARTIQPNPWAEALGSTLGGVGSGLASNASTKPPKTPKPSGPSYYDGGR